MGLRRAFVDDDRLSGAVVAATVILPESVSHRLRRVLRLEDGAAVATTATPAASRMVSRVAALVFDSDSVCAEHGSHVQVGEQPSFSAPLPSSQPSP